MDEARLFLDSNFDDDLFRQYSSFEEQMLLDDEEINNNGEFYE